MKNVKLITSILLILTAFQGMIPIMPLENPTLVTILSAVTLFVVQGLTAWRQHLNSLISTTAERFTIGMFIIALIGGLFDLSNVFTFSDSTSQWIRFGLTAATMIVNLISPIMWPEKEQRRY